MEIPNTDLIDQKIILDSKVLMEIYTEGDNLEDLSNDLPKEIKINMELLRRLYNEKYFFHKKGLIKLLNDLNYLDSGKLRTVAFLFKFKNYEEDELNEDIKYVLTTINFESANICLAAIESNVPEVFFRYYKNNNDYHMFIYAAKLGCLEVVRFF